MDSESPFLGGSEAARRVRKEVARAALVDSTVLVLGESGVGKELVAREIHLRSRRSGSPFIPLNCAAIPETLIENEMFGHEAGAFTDARTVRRGAFELAHGGTLFLDEVGDLSRVAQPKMLRAVESGSFFRVGGESAVKADVRLIAATNRDLLAMSREGAFREELYFRLRVIEIRVPPLRERREDIPLLAEHFARQTAEALGRPFRVIDDTALQMLREYPWPGNVRELRSALERALAMSSGHVLDAGCFALDGARASGLTLGGLMDDDWETATRKFEEAYARRRLERFQGNVRKAAESAGVGVRTFYKVLERLGIRAKSSRS